MKILAIETSCDETAISILETEGNLENPSFKILSHIVHTQIDMHREYGGVFPTVAKREHGKNLVPVLIEALEKAGLYKTTDKYSLDQVEHLFEKNPDLQESFIKKGLSIAKPDIDHIVVTSGPGLEPALWVGISFAKALNILWNIPLYPINHMEGHIASVLLAQNTVEFPAIALLVSGGHTELVSASKWGSYEILGQTVDDAVGEAFDKVARLLGLPYPGGPEISKLADEHRKTHPESTYFKLPRPMLHSKNLQFSFSGLKTAVRYALEKESEITQELQYTMAREFEDSVMEVIITKSRDALEEHHPKTFILSGGVSANKELRSQLSTLLEKYPETTFLMPEHTLSTDNATMIALAGFVSIQSGQKPNINIVANGNLHL